MANKNPGKIHHSLDDCLERMEKENTRLEDCINDHPEHKNELTELINIRSALQDLQHISPPDEFYNNSPRRVTQVLVDQPVTFGEYIRHIFSRKRPKLRRRFSIAQFFVTLVLLIALATGGVYAADAAQPGDLLYGVDRALDQVKLIFISGPENVASTRLMYSAERLDEAKSKIELGELGNALIALEAYDFEMNQLAKMLASEEGLDREKLSNLLMGALEIHQVTLISLFEQVPEEAQKGILIAINSSMASLNAQLDPPEDTSLFPLIDIFTDPPDDIPVSPPGQRPIIPPGHSPDFPPGNRPIIPPGHSPDFPPGNRPIIPPGQWRQLPDEDSPFNPREDKPPHPREKIRPTPPQNNP